MFLEIAERSMRDHIQNEVRVAKNYALMHSQHVQTIPSIFNLHTDQ